LGRALSCERSKGSRTLPRGGRGFKRFEKRSCRGKERRSGQILPSAGQTNSVEPEQAVSGKQSGQEELGLRKGKEGGSSMKPMGWKVQRTQLRRTALRPQGKKINAPKGAARVVKKRREEQGVKPRGRKGEGLTHLARGQKEGESNARKRGLTSAMIDKVREKEVFRGREKTLPRLAKKGFYNMLIQKKGIKDSKLKY